MNAEQPLTILTGSANSKLAEKIGSILYSEVYNPTSKFANGETRIHIPVNIRRHGVFIIQTTSMPVNDHLMDLALMADAAKRASAAEITAVIPYYGYSRQDRKDRARVPISASYVAGMLKLAGIDRILTVDIHSEQQMGFFDGAWDNVYGSFSLVPIIKSKNYQDLVVASPDKGGVPRATRYAKLLNAQGIAIVYKERDVTRANYSEALDMIGHVEDKNVLIVDDMIDSGRTIINAANLLIQKGARSIRAATTHGLFSGSAFENIINSGIQEIFITDTIAQPEKVLGNPKTSIASVATLLAEAIKRIQSGESISEDLILK